MTSGVIQKSKVQSENPFLLSYYTIKIMINFIFIKMQDENIEG